MGSGFFQHPARDPKAFQRLRHAAIDADDMDDRADLVLLHAVVQRAPAMRLPLGHLAERSDHGEVDHAARLGVDHIIAPAEAPAPRGHRLLEGPREIVRCSKVLLHIFSAERRLARLASLLGEHSDIAAIIAEPLQRIIPAQPGFLQGLRDLCDKHGVLLIFDEIVTGFRLAYGGAQEWYGVTPDICTLGKIIGGGFPLAALGSSTEIMAHFDKAAVGAEKWLMQLGTLSGNPVASAAGLKTMEVLRRPGQYERLRELGQSLMDMQSAALIEQGIAHRICGDPALFDIYFTDAEPIDYRTAKHRDPKINEVWNTTLRANGVFKSPGKLYPSLALKIDDLELTRSAFQRGANAVLEYRTRAM